jgi:hypothetical protein
MKSALEWWSPRLDETRLSALCCQRAWSQECVAVFNLSVMQQFCFDERAVDELNKKIIVIQDKIIKRKW